jgi:hypothetical protein
LVSVTLVTPAVGEPLAEPGAADLTAQLGPKAPAGVAGAGGHCAFDVTEVYLHLRLQGPGKSSNKLHAQPAGRSSVMLIVAPDLYGRGFVSTRAVSPSIQPGSLCCALP